MTEKRAKELLRHIAEDKDYGAKMMESISLSESIYVVGKILKTCMNEAEEKGKDTDATFFAQMMDRFRPIVLDKIRNVKKVWVVYCETTGYPYDLDKDILVLFDHVNQKTIIDDLKKSGYVVTLLDEDSIVLKNEVGHMYRNGFKNIRFIDGVCEPFVVAREELYGFEEFYKDDYITNPGLQETMISFFQEFRKYDEFELNGTIITKREERMIGEMINAEYMVPCIKNETEDEVEISHPYVDMSQRLQSEEGRPIIAIPAFTDGYELDKCYNGTLETMLYSFKELSSLITEIGADGIVFNCMGVGYFMDKDVAEQVVKDKKL